MASDKIVLPLPAKPQPRGETGTILYKDKHQIEKAMKRTLVATAILLAASAGIHAQETGDYVLYFSDGKVSAYPKAMVKEFAYDNASGCQLTLKNDSVLTWQTGEIDSVSHVMPNYPVFTRFTLTEKKNDELSADIDAEITADKVTATVPTIGKYLTPTFETDRDDAVVSMNGVVQESGKSRLRFAGGVTYTIGFPGHQRLDYVKIRDEVWSGQELLEPAVYAYSMVPMGREVQVGIDWKTEHATSVPRIDIETEGGVAVTSKDYYLNARVTIQGYGVWDDFQDSVQIKGRGNTSWRDFDKKPYRLKFDKSVRPFGLKKGKNWNLLAQAQTGSMMTNPVTMKIARMVDAAAANDVIPVELYLNGEYRGSYIFTQKTGLANNSVDLEDEAQAVLLELDKYYDETYKFKSAEYNLPVNIKDPDLSENETMLNFEQIQQDFNLFEAAVRNNTHFERLTDMDKLVRFMLVNELVLNTELGHPKSVFLYRENLNHLGSRYTFGPVWDFDWAFGYGDDRKYCTTSIRNDLFNSYDTSRPGNKFFTTLWHSSKWVKHLYLRLWNDFMANHLQEVLDYIDDYYAFAQTSFRHNTSVWNDGHDYENNASRMKQWLTERAEYLLETLKTQADDNGTIPYTFGDTNKDGTIDSEDLQAVLDHLLEIQQLKASDEELADIDADNAVSASDVAWMCNLISPPEETVSLADWETWTAHATENKAPVSLAIESGSEEHTGYLAVKLANQIPYIACMIDFDLPEGVSVTEGEPVVLTQRTTKSHTAIGKTTANGGYRIILYSEENRAIADTAGVILKLPIETVRTMEEEACLISANNVRFVTTRGTEVTLNDAQTLIEWDANSIGTPATTNDCWPKDIYDIQGRLIRKNANSLDGLSKGIYLINKRKVVKE